MKNLFKKITKPEAKTTLQKLDKNQLVKVIGGVDGSTSESATTDARKKKLTGTGFEAQQG